MSIFEFCAVGSLVVSAIGVCVTVANSWDIRVVHRATNSMKDELVKTTRIAADALGEARGRKMQKNEDARS